MSADDVRPTVTRHTLDVTVWVHDDPHKLDPTAGTVAGAVALLLAEAGLDVDVTHAGSDRTSVRIVQNEPMALSEVLSKVPGVPRD